MRLKESYPVAPLERAKKMPKELEHPGLSCRHSPFKNWQGHFRVPKWQKMLPRQSSLKNHTRVAFIENAPPCKQAKLIHEKIKRKLTTRVVWFFRGNSKGDGFPWISKIYQADPFIKPWLSAIPSTRSPDLSSSNDPLPAGASPVQRERWSNMYWWMRYQLGMGQNSSQERMVLNSKWPTW